MCPPVIPALLTIGSMAAATAVSVASSKKQAEQQARASKAQAEAIQQVNGANRNVRNSVEKTANQLKDNQSRKRTINSLRIPLNTSSTGINTGAVNQTGLNIPI